MRTMLPLLLLWPLSCAGDGYVPLDVEPRVASICECVCLDPPCVCGMDSEGSSDSLGTSDSSSSSASSTGSVASSSSTGSVASSSSGSSDESSGSSGSSSTGTPPPVGPPEATGPCPPIVDGTATFCPAAASRCWDVELADTGDGSPDASLFLYWHGTTRTPALDLALSNNIVAWLRAEQGIVALPWAPDEHYAASPPHPWYGDGGLLDPEIWLLADEVAGCVLEAGLADPDRLTVSGMSNGGITASLFVEARGWAAAVGSWSGGQPELDAPTVPASPLTHYIGVHGGPTDVYACLPEENCPGGVFPFQAIATDSATEVAMSGAFTMLCDHGGGHATILGQGAGFLGAAERGVPHPWDGYAFAFPGGQPDSPWQWTGLMDTIYSWPLSQYCTPLP